MISEEEQERRDGSEYNHPQVYKNYNLSFWFNNVYYALIL